MRRFTRRPSPATVLSGMALFVSLGGVSYGVATSSIDSREIKNDSVRGKDIRNGTIKSKDVGNGSLLLGDFKKAERARLRGRRGATGATGAPGTAGSAQAFAFVSKAQGGATPALVGRRKGFTAVSHSPAKPEVYCLTWAPGQTVKDPVIATYDYVRSDSDVASAALEVREGALASDCPAGRLQVNTYNASGGAPLASDQIAFFVLVP